MKRVAILLFAAILICTSFARADAVITWLGDTWEVNNASTDLSIVDDNLVIDTTASPGWAQFGGLGYNSVNTDYYEVMFDLDLGGEPAIMTADYSTPLGGDVYQDGGQFGISVSDGMIIYDDGDDGMNLNMQFDFVSMPTSGIHTAIFELDANGLMNISIPGYFSWQAPSTDYEINTISALYLGAMDGEGATGVFVDHAVPEPATLSLLALGGLAVLARKKK